jgi:hypothetical protein
VCILFQDEEANMSPWSYRLLRVSLLLLVGGAVAWASISGMISGVVTDPSGAVIPNAEVTVTEIASGVAQTVRTTADGVYSFLSLPVGRYKLEVKATSFQTYLRTDITLNTNDQLRFDAVLTVGEVTQRIEVTTSAVHVETANTQLGDVIQSGSVEAMPLNGRLFTNLLSLQPGVVPRLALDSMNNYGTTGQGNLSISGQRETANGFLVNGSNVDNIVNNGTAIYPNLDSIAEFRILTANFDAEHGNYSGGLVSVVTKSGTNRVHGSGFDFVRNTNLDARNFYDRNSIDPVTGNELPGTARGRFQQNQFGGTIGGPIKHEKVFFFADYQGTRTTQGQSSGLVPVPSPAERTGDFSAVASSMTGTVIGPYFANVLTQELGYPVTAGENYYTAGCTSTSQCVFPNAIIPQSAFSAPAKALMHDIPFPTSGPYFVSSANKVHTRDDLWAFRIDANSSRWGMISGYYFFDDNFQFLPFGANNTPGFPSENGGRGQLWTLGDTKNFGASALNELHLSWNRLVNHTGKPVGNYPVSLSSLGFEEGAPGGFEPASPAYEGVPEISFSSGYSFGLSDINYNRYIETPSVIDNFSKVMGRHTVKLGGQYTFNDFYEPMPLVIGNGSMSFYGAETGIDFADYLVGALNSCGQEGGFFLDNRRSYAGVYAQDSWRAKPSFTLNYGLRWEVFQPWYEKSLQSSTLVYGVTSTVYPGAPTGYAFPGDNVPGFGKIPNTISRTQHDNFSPRLGFAYSPSASGGVLGRLLGGPGKFSIRGGFGMFYTNLEGSLMTNEAGLTPFDVYTVVASPMFAAPYTNRATGAIQPVPFPFTAPPRGSSSFDWAKYLPLTAYTVPEINARTPYSENYSFTLQRQLGANTLFTVGFVGSQGHRLLAFIENNPGNPQLCLSLSQASEVAPGTATCGPTLENSVFTRADGTTVNGTREPFGNNFGDDYWMNTMANSNYNALELSVRHTMGRLSLFASYTYSKSLDNASTQADKAINPFNARLSKGLSTFDLTHNFVVSYTYVLPIDRLAGNRRPRLTSGWRMVGLTHFDTGFPIVMNEDDDRSLVGIFSFAGEGIDTDTPDFLGGNLSITNPRTGKPYFNTSLFQPEQLGRFGTANRAFFHGPGTNNFDMSLQKDLKLTESKTLEFRGEFFNIFNHAQFFGPSGDINGNFGIVTSAAAPRIGQVALKFLF